MLEEKDDKIIDLPTDGPGAEVTLPEETAEAYMFAKADG